MNRNRTFVIAFIAGALASALGSLTLTVLAAKRTAIDSAYYGWSIGFICFAAAAGGFIAGIVSLFFTEDAPD